VPRKLPSLALPLPSLSSRDLPLVSREAPLYRLYPLKFDPAFWGKTGQSRFDAPRQDYGVMYAAYAFEGAFIEAFGEDSSKTIEVRDLSMHGVAIVEPARTLRLVDLAGPGLSRLGLDARICSGDYEIAQQWSHALWAHPSQPDGIWYAARRDPGERSVALFERETAAVTVSASGTLMDAPYAALTVHAIKRYGFALVD
jgi:hypothetical protein